MGLSTRFGLPPFKSMGSAKKGALAISLASMLTLATPASSAIKQASEAQTFAGDLDPTFGSAGKVVSGLAGRSTFSRSIVIQPDAKIVVAGIAIVGADQNSRDFALARHNPDGMLDSSFGEGGFALIDFRGSGDELLAVTLQNDGKIVAVGLATTCCSLPLVDFAIARLNADGTPDNSFGIDGKVSTDFADSVDRAVAVQIQADGKILLVGRSDEKVAFARYEPDGKLDSSFGTGGKTTEEFTSFTTSINAATFQQDGKIVVVGKAGTDFVLARYNPDGSRDTGFGTSGVVSTDLFGFDDIAKAVSIQPDGKIVVVGEALRNQITADFGVVRYQPDGRLDKKFGKRGKLGTDFAHGYDGANAVAIDADGRILAAGFAERGSDDFGLARYDSNGNLDAVFGTSGVVTTDVMQRDDEATAIALQPDSKIVVAGNARTPEGGTQFGLVRYLAPAPDFQIALSQNSVSVNQGSNVSVKVLPQRLGGFQGNVRVTPPDGSAFGVKVKPSVPVSTTGESVTFKLKAKSSAIPGIYPMVIVGIDDLLRVRVATLILVVHQAASN
ncbi:MAG TPA: delta-60 repeat domain-containing protein [Blastocatellia bacterium]|nr:delta-60 repeat domain-containing protein [Blastocatellia bacterium]